MCSILSLCVCVSATTGWACGSLIWSNTCSMRSTSQRSECSTENGLNVSTSTFLWSTRSTVRESTSTTSEVLQHSWSYSSQFCLFCCWIRLFPFHLGLQTLRSSLWSLRILCLKTATLRISSRPTLSLRTAPSKTPSSITQVPWKDMMTDCNKSLPPALEHCWLLRAMI